MSGGGALKVSRLELGSWRSPAVCYRLEVRAFFAGPRSFRVRINMQWLAPKPFPMLEELAIRTAAFPPAHPDDHHLDIVSEPVYTTPLPSTLRRALLQCPCLRVVRHKTAPEFGYQSTRHPVALIRTYVRDGDVLTHIRTFSPYRYFPKKVCDLRPAYAGTSHAWSHLTPMGKRALLNLGYRLGCSADPQSPQMMAIARRSSARQILAESGEEIVELMIVTNKETWEDTVELNGEALPQAVLQAVYKAIAWDLEWTTPGRDMELPAEGWAVLKEFEERRNKGGKALANYIREVKTDIKGLATGFKSYLERR